VAAMVRTTLETAFAPEELDGLSIDGPAAVLTLLFSTAVELMTAWAVRRNRRKSHKVMVHILLIAYPPKPIDVQVLYRQEATMPRSVKWVQYFYTDNRCSWLT
jgi:hypothetical protein